MIFNFCFAAALILIMQIGVTSQAQNRWKGIRPLYTSRAETERLLGQPRKVACQVCEYETDSELVQVTYSASNCEEGWNVPINTVLLVRVAAKLPPVLSSLSLDRSNYLRYSSDSSDISYVFQNKGTVFEVDEDLGRLNAMRFMPLETDNKLRCEGFPHYNPMGSIYYPTDTTEEMDIETLNQWLDSFIIQSKHVSTLYRTYVFVYFGDNLHKREYGTLFERLKNHAYLKRRISLEDFKIIKGGKRAKFGMEVFIIRRGAPPPVPSPTKP